MLEDSEISETSAESALLSESTTELPRDVTALKGILSAQDSVSPRPDPQSRPLPSQSPQESAKMLTPSNLTAYACASLATT